MQSFIGETMSDFREHVHFVCPKPEDLADLMNGGKTLAAAIKATFETRGTAVPSEIPLALTAEFYDDREKNVQWNAFINKSGLSADIRSLRQIAAILVDFLMPVSHAVTDQGVFDQDWNPSGPWK